MKLVKLETEGGFVSGIYDIKYFVNFNIGFVSRIDDLRTQDN